MLFAIGFVAMFTIGGLSGVTHAVVPSDTQQTDTYYIVAHFHYVLFGGSMFGLFGGAYYWWPKFSGHFLSDKIGKLHFWIMLIGFNLTFGPFHILGLQGMPRRIYTYPEGKGWDFWNFASTIGSFLIALSVLVFLYNMWISRKNPHVGDDPWDARTLEWSIPSPPPEYNFAEIPLVTARDDLWHRKYTEDDEGRAVRREAPMPAVVRARTWPSRTRAPTRPMTPPEAPHAEEPVHIHLPSPSYWPALTALALPIIAYGMIYKAYVVAALGGVMDLRLHLRLGARARHRAGGAQRPRRRARPQRPRHPRCAQRTRPPTDAVPELETADRS